MHAAAMFVSCKNGCLHTSMFCSTRRTTVARLPLPHQPAPSALSCCAACGSANNNIQNSSTDKHEVAKACDEIKSYPPLIFAGECRNLQERLAKAAVGEAFILQGGDCAEAFTQFSANRIRCGYQAA
jgi:hypothetical protein